ncbi:hypothetical protein QLQ12_44940 [Actinoplanes sp. NEAU-A12]|uniref:Uncharacterized protein n=1 Tax=Actinoplanes sandaracinus TaxID=3045177 RepID=A0ABT6X166_9ACTN|nr:hypothetical protein [Actinoplanes sandaracinus]MDI6105748.1 hypothetical protein [Actinoplanes sandaracinus]
MPEQPLDPEGLRRLARNLLNVPADFTSQKTKGPVNPIRVPAETRTLLEAARTALLRRIVDSPDYAREFNEAVQRMDRGALLTLGESAARSSDDVEVKVVDIDNDFWCVFSFCAFGFCASIGFGW